MTKDKSPKLTRTATHVTDNSPREGFDGVSYRRPIRLPSGYPRPGRLGFSITPKMPYNTEEICHALQLGHNNSLFFCDTSMFDTKTEQCLWDFLLGKNCRVVLIAPVVRELAPWMARNKDHVFVKAIAERHPSIVFDDFDGVSDRERNAFAYYVSLLSSRKRLLTARVAEFVDVNGRAPAESELKRIKEKLHNDYGPRGYLLARKGAETAIEENFYIDEVLVVRAMMTAIHSGREVFILSKDEDIQEQFYKMQWLMDTQYRGMLLARRYVADLLSFVRHPFPREVKNIDEMFYADGGFLIERSDRMIDAVLPEQYEFVYIHCMIIGELFTSASFEAESGMAGLLAVKGDTRGLNTSQLGGMNCHLWLAPLDIPMSLRNCAAIAYDRRVSLKRSSVEMPVFDIYQAVFCQERFKHVRVSPLAL